MKYILLNQPHSNCNSDTTNSQKLPLSAHHNTASPKLNGFVVLPLIEQETCVKINPTTVPLQPNCHPTVLLKHFPPRPHYYLSHTVGAQAGYCLSPLPPCLPDQRNCKLMTDIGKTVPTPSNKHLKTSPPCRSSNSQPSSSSSPAASISPTPSSFLLSSHPVASSSSSSSSSSSCTLSSSLSPLTRTIESKTTTSSSSSISENHPCDVEPLSSKLSATSSPEQDGMNSENRHMMTKKVLPTPPSLSTRVRQIFINKINSQQAASCAQLPRRKKKKAVDEPVA